MKDDFDKLLRDALKPDIQPDEKLNEEILNGKRIVEMKPRRFFGATAAAVILVLILCPIGVYAASKALGHKTNVKEKSISVGNSDFVPDDDKMAEIATPDNAVKSDTVATEEGTEDTLWLKKEVIQLSNSVKNTRYYYDSFEKAVEDAKFDKIFRTEYTLSYYATCTIVDMGVNYVPEYHLSAGFDYKDSFFTITLEKRTSNTASDVAYTVPMQNTGNQRTYENSSGLAFDLVDEHKDGKTYTYSIIYNDGYLGYLCFENMSDETIHEVLDNTLME